MDQNIEIKEEQVWFEGTGGTLFDNYEMTHLKEETTSELVEPGPAQVNTYERFTDVNNEKFIEEHTVGQLVPCFKEDNNEQNGAVLMTGPVHSCDSSCKPVKTGRELMCNMPTNTGEQSHCCNMCNYYLMSPSTEESFYRKKCNNMFTAKGDLEEGEYSSRKGALSCNECGNTFSGKSSLKNHLLSHTGDRPFSCNECSSTFSRKCYLKNHMLTHTGERPHRCKECGKSFNQRAHLQTHVFTHTGLRPYDCSECSRAFSRKANLESHMLIHSANRRYSCNDCCSTFFLKSVYLKHMLTHTRERPHRCNDCGKSYFRKSDLAAHLLFHTGERPHSCSDCGRKFSRKSNLKEHMRLHSGDRARVYCCNKCGTTFLRKFNLKLHMRTHLGKPPHGSNECC